MQMTLSASLRPYPTTGDAQIRTSDDTLHYCKTDGIWTAITGGGGGSIPQGAVLPPAPVVNDVFILTTDDTLHYCKSAGIWTSLTPTLPGGTLGAVQVNDGSGGFAGDVTKLQWTNSPDRLTISKWDGVFPMPAPIIDSNCILSLSTTGNATNFWFAVPAAGTNASFGFSTGGLGFKHAMTYMIMENKLALTAFGAMGAPSDGLYVDASNNVSIGYINPIPSKLYVGGTFAVTGESYLGAAVTYRVTSTAINLLLDATHHVVLCTNSVTISLPPAVSCPGRTYIIKSLFFGSLVQASFLNLIDGNPQYVFPAMYSSIIVVSDGVSSWNIVAKA